MFTSMNHWLWIIPLVFVSYLMFGFYGAFAIFGLIVFIQFCIAWIKSTAE